MEMTTERLPLWRERWDPETLAAKRRAVGERAYQRGFRQLAMSDEEKTFPSFGRCLRKGVVVSELVDEYAPRYIGADPFGKWVVIFVLALTRDPARRVPVAIYRGQKDPAEFVNLLLEANRIHRPSRIKVENVAAQEAIVQWCKEKATDLVLPIEGFMTGKQKADPTVGLPSLEVEFANGSWGISDPDHTFGCQCAWCVWFEEMRGHPIYPTQDAVMACWFAREASRGAPIVADTAPEQPDLAEIRRTYSPDRSSIYAPERRFGLWRERPVA